MKRKLEIVDDEFSDCDEEQLVHQLEKVEREIKKPKLDFICDICGKSYQQIRNKIQHMKTHCTSFKCRKCDKQFSRDYARKQHENKCTEKLKESKSKTLTCIHCGTPFDTSDTLFQRVIENHPLKNEDKAGIIQKGGDVKSTPQNSIRKRSDKDGDVESTPQIITKECGKKERVVRKGALNDTLNQTQFFPEGSEQHDLLNFFANSKSDVENELKTRLEKVRGLKWYLNVKVEMVRDIDNGKKEKAIPHFRSRTYISLANDDNEHNLNEAYQKNECFPRGIYTQRIKLGVE